MFVNLFFLLLKYKSFEPLFVSATDSTMDWWVKLVCLVKLASKLKTWFLSWLAVNKTFYNYTKILMSHIYSIYRDYYTALFKRSNRLVSIHYMFVWWDYVFRWFDMWWLIVNSCLIIWPNNQHSILSMSKTKTKKRILLALPNKHWIKPVQAEQPEK